MVNITENDVINAKNNWIQNGDNLRDWLDQYNTLYEKGRYHALPTPANKNAAHDKERHPIWEKGITAVQMYQYYTTTRKNPTLAELAKWTFYQIFINAGVEVDDPNIGDQRMQELDWIWDHAKTHNYPRSSSRARW
jgi:hypothetical protein